MQSNAIQHFYQIGWANKLLFFNSTNLKALLHNLQLSYF